MRCQVLKESESAHGCCFSATIIDTSIPTGLYDRTQTVCECPYLIDAEYICDLLNHFASAERQKNKD